MPSTMLLAAVVAAAVVAVAGAGSHTNTSSVDVPVDPAAWRADATSDRLWAEQHFPVGIRFALLLQDDAPPTMSVPAEVIIVAGGDELTAAEEMCDEIMEPGALPAGFDFSRKVCLTALRTEIRRHRTFPWTNPQVTTVPSALLPYFDEVFALEMELYLAGHPVTEGHIASCPAKVALVVDVVEDAAAATPPDDTVVVCEVGFNAGHSAVGILMTAPNVVVHTFDLGEYEYSQQAMQYVSQRFQGRLTPHVGRSQDTLTAVLKRRAAGTAAPTDPPHCDIAFVDGSHAFGLALADLSLTRYLVRARHVLFDDATLRSTRFQAEYAWQTALAAGFVTEHRRVACDGEVLAYGTFT